jgi:hypothetical protein
MLSAAFHAADPPVGQHLGAEGVFLARGKAQDVAREAEADRGLAAIRQYAHQTRRAFRQRIDVTRIIALMENRRAGLERHALTIRSHVIQGGGIQRRAKPKGA